MKPPIYNKQMLEQVEQALLKVNGIEACDWERCALGITYGEIKAKIFYTNEDQVIKTTARHIVDSNDAPMTNQFSALTPIRRRFRVLKGIRKALNQMAVEEEQVGPIGGPISTKNLVSNFETPTNPPEVMGTVKGESLAKV